MVRLLRGLAAALLLLFGTEASAAQRADAVLLVNSAAPRFGDAERYVRPYLDHFGIPYTVLDLTKDPVGPEIGDYALIVIGHAGIDTSGLLLNSAAQENLVAAVALGSGLVSFDSDLTTGEGNAPRYPFLQQIFGFDYGAPSTGEGIWVAPDAPTHYVTSLQTPGQVKWARQMAAATLVPADESSVLLRFFDTGNPLLVAASYGQGRALQWASAEWMSRASFGPLRGLDDLFWRGAAWAARKPFVMQGLPSFVTMRVDDVQGDFWWVDVANALELKPWLGLFYKSIPADFVPDLRRLTVARNATAAVHAGDGWFYYDHFQQADYPDETITANFDDASAWHASNGIPISSFVAPHFYEIGTNAFARLRDWGVRSIATHMTPGSPYGAPWLQLAPFRRFETGPSDDTTPVTYADYLAVPGHSDLDGRFFTCVTEIRDDANYEWYPVAEDVQLTVDRGTRQLKRALDAMSLATLFTHEPFIHEFAPADWQAALQAILSNVQDYHPIFVTMDDACEYLRAKHDSRIEAASYDPLSQQLTVDLAGTTAVATQLLVFTDGGGMVVQTPMAIPAFAGGASVSQAVAPTPAPTLTRVSVTPASTSLAPGAVHPFSAIAVYSDGSAWNVTNHAVWASTAPAVAAVDDVGVATASSLGSTTITATFGGISGTAALVVRAVPLVVSADELPGGAVGVPYAAALAATGGTPPYAWTIASGALPAGLALAPDGTISGTPTVGGSATFVIAVTDAALGSATRSEHIAVNDGAALSLWPLTASPEEADAGPDEPVELGVKFRSEVAGAITALRFYKSAANGGEHIGSLWSSDGTLLARARFTGESTAGWQEVQLVAPVAIAPATIYVASYHATRGHYAHDVAYFDVPLDQPPLQAPASTEVAGGNGVFGYGPSPRFPTDSAAAPNYWVDVVLRTDGAPTLTSIAVAPGTASVPAGASQAFVAIGTFSDGSSHDISGQVTWSSSSPAIATVNEVGGATTGQAGSATISATVGPLSGVAVLTVTPVLTAVTVTPASVRLLAGGTQRFTATGYDAAGVPIPGLTFTWSAASGGAVGPDGSFTAGSSAGAFTGNVVATSGGVSGAASTETVALSGLSLAPAALVGGAGATATLTLSAAAPAGGAQVALASDTAGVTVPASVAVDPGATGATFPVGTAVVSQATTATVSATLGTSATTATLAVAPPPAALSSVTLSPSTVAGGLGATGTVTLAGLSAAPVVVALSSSSAAAVVPAQVTVPAGAATATFAVTTSPVAADVAATITAVAGAVTRTAVLTVGRPALASVKVAPTAVAGGSPALGTVTLTGPAPAPGIVVALSDSKTAATAPPSVTVPAGALSAAFTILTTPVASNSNVTITGTLDGVTRTGAFSVGRASVSTVTITPSPVVGGSPATGTVTLTGPAAGSGLTVHLSDDSSSASLPNSVTVAAGASRATFALTTSPVVTATTITVTAMANGVSRTGSFSLTPPGIASLSLSPAAVPGGASSTATVTLTGPAPAGGTTVTLASGGAAAAVPPSVSIGPGGTTATFPITTSVIASTTSVALTALTGGTSGTATLTVRGLAVSSVSIGPASIKGGGTATGTVTLTGPALATGFVARLADNSAATTVPASVTVGPGATTATFQITSVSVASATTVTITATGGAVTASGTLAVTP